MLFRLSIAISNNYGSRGGMIGRLHRIPRGFDNDDNIIAMDYFFFFGNTVNFETSNSINSIENEYE